MGIFWAVLHKKGSGEVNMPVACRLPEALILLMVTWEGLEPPTLWFVGIARAFAIAYGMV